MSDMIIMMLQSIGIKPEDFNKIIELAERIERIEQNQHEILERLRKIDCGLSGAPIGGEEYND